MTLSTKEPRGWDGCQKFSRTCLRGQSVTRVPYFSSLMYGTLKQIHQVTVVHRLLMFLDGLLTWDSVIKLHSRAGLYEEDI